MERSPPAAKLDELCINTIRTLAMDAVQKANSGHPGTPMALAPVAYTLYTRVMRHNPANAAWPNATASCCPAARLDAALLGALPLRLRSGARGPRELPPARLALRRTPGVRTRPGDRGDHRPARTGHLELRRSGARRAAARGALQPRRARDHRPPHLHDRLRRRHGGGHLLRGLIAGRPLRTGTADRLLRRQPHLDRGRHPRSRSAKTSARATRPTAGTSSDSERTSRSNASSRPRGRRWR